MLLKYGARNFFCFKEGIEISLELGAKCPETISRGKPVSNLLCVKGANGSGKTNALKALSFLRSFCRDSFNSEPSDEIMIDSYFLNDDPIDLFCDFVFGETQYRYELSLTTQKVVSEKFFRKVDRLSLVVERRGDELTHCVREFRELKKIKQRTNASIISLAHQYQITNLSPFYEFFNSVRTNVAFMGRIDFSGEYRTMSKYYNDNPEVFNSTVNIIKECDLGISDVRIFSRKEEDNKTVYFPLFEHDAEVEDNILTFFSQSLGTQTLFKILPYFFYTLWTGGVLVIDEFDVDLHPHILRKIVALFDNDNSNPKNAQIIFSTHNTDILEYMGKYRTVLVNKETSEAYGYRLDEIPGDIIRNDRLISPVYNSGKIGGVPRI